MLGRIKLKYQSIQVRLAEHSIDKEDFVQERIPYLGTIPLLEHKCRLLEGPVG